MRELLFQEPARFDFFQAVRLLERLQPARRPIGRHSDPARESVRLAGHATLVFPPSEIEAIRLVKRDPSPWTIELIANFMGLYGPLGVLPVHYTELIAERGEQIEEETVRPLRLPRRRARKAALQAFLDLFNHRLLSLFYRAWEKYRFPIAHERGDDDRFSDCIRAFIGVQTSAATARLGIPDHTLLYYAGLLAKRPRSAAALEAVLEDHFNVPVKVQQFHGAWFRLSDESRTQLAPGGRNELGVSAGLWERFWDPQVRFRVALGPLPLDTYRAFLPSGTTHTQLVQFTRFFVGEEFGFDIQLILRKEEVPPCQIGGSTPATLGWSSWLADSTSTRDRDDAVFVGREAVLAEATQH